MDHHLSVSPAVRGACSSPLDFSLSSAYGRLFWVSAHITLPASWKQLHDVATPIICCLEALWALHSFLLWAVLCHLALSLAQV